ncbi:2-hydroxy-6-oxononadienedioate/2-hydroxy-6-oxononatrienedioate hydrolase-like isoform X1 [Triticum dicoccoides]|uniref:2-hydroxy-6-oxononadienedioate/2-hydroxy-6- oxononatrienedioate hydrolase-like isoform X1 n=1 Tax=Triticum dicoccoides TaxID=85692 RepID=UPI000E7A7568|nr:2-hydroxy-6-oxononadienedioate/2-hydroxy-6-oxononatrienedioate hydrolase-like isoform X1 [Triticum dicoccoides]
MVNWVEVLRKHFVARLATNAGLRQHAVAVDEEDGTVINFWLPNHNKALHMNHCQHHPVVLVHGFAGDGMMTSGFQVGALAKCGHDVYVPDLVHFGGSTSRSPDRSVAFQARCLAAALRNLGVARPCTVVGFSYGGFVAFEMAAAFPGLVRSVVVSGCTVTYTDAMKDALLGRHAGARSITELMLPETVEQLRLLFSSAMHMKMWFPRRLVKVFLKVMCNNRKERAEMLDDMVNMRGKEASAPVFQQNILLLWGENDNFFPVEDGESLKEELGEKATLQTISKAGHLAQLERPCVYNRYLKKFLAAHSPFELYNRSS